MDKSSNLVSKRCEHKNFFGFFMVLRSFAGQDNCKYSLNIRRLHGGSCYMHSCQHVLCSRRKYFSIFNFFNNFTLYHPGLHHKLMWKYIKHHKNCETALTPGIPGLWKLVWKSLTEFITMNYWLDSELLLDCHPRVFSKSSQKSLIGGDL